MNNNMEHKKQFEALLALLLDNKLADHEFDALIALAEHNPELKNQLSEQLTIDNLVRQRFEATDLLDNFVNQTVTTAFENKTNKRFESDIISAITNNQFDKRPADDNIVRGYFPWLLTALSTAACALLSFHFLTAEPNHDKSNHAEATQLTTQLSEPTEHKAKPQYEYQDLGVAVIANAIGLHENAIFKIGDSVKPGQLHLSEGFLELEFYRGAQLKISGPAAINIINEERVELISGKVMTDVPKVAIGFTIDTPNSEIIDLGTEIGVEVTKDGLSQVHVFEGLVEVRNDLGYQQLIEKGQAINFSGETRSEWRDDIASKAKFAEFNTIDDLTGTAISQQHQKWLSVKAEVLADSNLVTYYDFEPSAKKPRILTNLSSHGDKHHGAIVGARWSQGPWQGKHALKFKRASDRVRVDIEEKLTSFTMATWVKMRQFR
ncbi:FecR family protein [Psychrosphaera algicola]|uniref:FecR domain-containing protein n=1 Tax=Psychrosphaera algicola TaxID=3023714 RepID=A0ABT5FAR1_9GAMM|nr:FecR family protein [Psychrosphaera sp. G1-22]MDC2887676.1 FecR domain-containing protein [Psychrosphaera sp. G1-22]